MRLRRTVVVVSIIALLVGQGMRQTANAAAAVTLRSTSTVVADGTAFTVAKPAGLATSDVMVAALSMNSGGAVTAPSGWTLIAHTESLGVVELWTYYRVAGASEPASYTWTTGSGAAGTAGIAAYVGADTTSPIIGFSSATDGGGASAATAPAVTSTGTGVSLLFLTVDGSFSGSVTYPSGHTQRWSLQDYERGYAADNLTNITGNLPARTITLSAANFWSIQQVALRASSGTPAPPPTITSIAPTSGSTLGGTSVTVNGTGFQAGATVSLGGTALTVGTVTPTSITGTTGAHAAGQVSVVVTNTDGQSGTCTTCYTYAPPAPAVTSLSPSSGRASGGTAVTINGTGFQTGATASFGGSALTVTNVTATAITGTTTAHAAGAVDVIITNPDAQSATCTGCFTYVPPPTVSSVTPGSGQGSGGTSVTVNGTGFLSGATASFGGSSLAITNVTPTAITGTTTAHTVAPVDVVVTNTDGQSGTCAACYAYTPPPPPVASSVTPNSGITTGGTSVTINGTGFSIGATASFGGSTLAITSITPTAISGTTTAHAAGAVDAVVTNADAQTSTCTGCYTYTPPPPPTVASVTPNNGLQYGGTSVTINGSGFQAGATASFGGAMLTVTNVAATSITGTTTGHAPATVTILVTNPDAQTGTCSLCYTYVAPPPATVTSVNPNTGTTLGGTTATVNGTNFFPGLSVKFGGAATTVTNITPTTITVTTPAHAAGLVDVTVTNDEQSPITCGGCYTYVAPPAPNLTSVTPNNGSTAGATSVTVNGANFIAGATVSFGGSALAITNLTATTITGTTTAHAAGAVTVTVTNPDTQSGSCSACYTYIVPPSVTLRSLSTLAGSGGRTQFVINTPSPLVANDVMIASLHLNGGGAVTAPTGWTLIAHTVNASVVHLWTYYHVATGIEPTSYTFKSSSAAGVAGIAAYTGIDTTSPIIGFSSATPTTAAATAPGVTSTVPSVSLLSLTIDGGFTGTATQPTGYTQRWGLTNYERGFFSDNITVAGGNLPAQTITLSGSGGYAAIQQIALRVGSGGPAPAPTITSVSPNTGTATGGNPVTINGTGFQSGASATIGGAPLSGATVTPTAISGTTPAHATGAVNVVVTNPDTQSATCTNCFTYVAPAPAPTITSVSPTSGTSAGGATVTVNGTNFQTGATAAVGGVALTATTVSATAIPGTTGAHAPGAVNVVVTNPDQQNVTATNAYTYNAAAAPTVTSVSPNTGPTTGGTAVTITGANFQSGATAAIGGATVTIATRSATQLTGTTTSRAAGLVDVVVTNNDAQTGTCSACFTYVGNGNAIQSENQLPGTVDWNNFDANSSPTALSGYGSKISVNHGESLDFFITTVDASVSIDIFRVGYYQGLGARRIAQLGSFAGRAQAIPAPDPVTGMVAATSWIKTTTLTIPSDWVTGVYLAKLTGNSGKQSFIFFVVRNDGGHEKYVFQTSVTTYEAYNLYGGTSLYSNTSNKATYSYAAATKVSFDRPFEPTDGNGAGQFTRYEYPFIRWAESQGYDLTYTTDVDTHTNVNPLTNHKAFLSVGHDEYWTKEMRDNVTAARDAGVNLGIFSANTMYWQIRLESNSLGAPNRVQVGYKSFALSSSAPGPDPLFGVDNSRVTGNWRDWPVSNPEQTLFGVMFEGTANELAYVVQGSTSWVYAGTGLTDASRVNGIVGYEYDRLFTTYVDGVSGDTITVPAIAGLTILSRSPVGSSYSNSTLYTAASGARVFAAGTIEWSSGLDSSGYGCTNGCVSAALQQVTRNIFANFGN